MFKDALTNKIALVTGASRGIGQGIALGLGKAGATVVGTATSEQGIREINKQFANHGIVGHAYILNVTDKEAIYALIAQIKEEIGMVNILLNNAAIAKDNLFIRMKDEEWDHVLATNLTALFHLSKACLRDMLKARWGRIINIGSVVGATGNAGQVNYAAAKAGMIGFCKSLALEVGTRNITVNAIAPGYVATDMTNALNEQQREMILSRIPMQKIGTVEDIAHAALFLASDAANYITGQTLHVNGGMYMN